METLLFVLVVILLFWISSINNRLHKLEKREPFGLSPEPSKNPASTPSYRSQPHTAAQASESMPAHQAAAAEASHKLLGHEAGIFDQLHTNSEAGSPEPSVSKNQNPLQQESIQTQKQTAKMSDNEVEANIATGWLNKIGVVAILLGMGFFFKFAIDQGWITPAMRIAAGFLVGGLFILLGWLWREKYAKYADVLIGGGVAILYFTIYAGYDFYQLFSQPFALGLMVLVSAGAAFLAQKRKSFPLAILAGIGAYGGPIFLSSGENRQVQLFVYLTVVNLAVFALVFKNYWQNLLFFALIATNIDFWIWSASFSTKNNTAASAIFSTVTFVLFMVVSAILFRKHHKQSALSNETAAAAGILTVLNGAIFTITVFGLLYADFRPWLVMVALLGGVASLLAYAIIDRLEFVNLNYCLSFVAACLLFMALYWHFDGKTQILSLILLADFGVLMALLFKRAELRVWSICILFIAMFLALFESYPGNRMFLFNSRFGLLFLTVVSMFASSWQYKFFPETAPEKNSKGVLLGAGILLLWLAVSFDISHYYPTLNGDYGLSLWWIVYPVLLAGAGAYFKKSSVTGIALFLAAISLVKSLIVPYPVGDHQFIFNFKFGLMFLQTAALYTVGWLSEKSGEAAYLKGAGRFFTIITALFLWIVVSWDITAAYLGLGGIYALSLWWIIYPILLAYLASKSRDSLLGKLALVLLFFSFFRIITASYDDLAYVFIFNAKFGLMLLEVVALLFVAKSFESGEQSDPSRASVTDVLKVVASLLLWFAFSWELTQYFRGTGSENTRNLTLSVWWIVYSSILIAYGVVRKSAVFRKVAILLFGLSILKVFLYDVQALELGYRVVSFIVLGVFLLSVSFAYQKKRDQIVKFLEVTK